ncbi:cobalamin biosynthesis protein [Lysobacter pythonis]|uniref:Cobalamin biosynthesis protein CobD n=1 Tax=Solilutibacter pythonis TaxID=2483112 RepID=A0A3M2I1A8_9GAMM|nr:adenosylcobinamide-phosphate synthase CbiB [Lysobacter pythonis]RMH94165.1 cobalamin biosynthesis protein [Lysobacter pythonis]
MAWPAILAAIVLDALLGEPRSAHPLVAFGRWAGGIERRRHRDSRAAGVLAWVLAVSPWVALCALAAHGLDAISGWLYWPFAVAVLYLAIGLKSLGQHARPVIDALLREDLAAARAAVGRVVSRDVDALSAEQVAGAATESVLENGADAVFGAIFWFAVLGPAGALLYRLANTLDAMWGYRNDRYRHFGWAAARIDDVLNFIPARLTALAYALCGRTRRALRCWRGQGVRWKSPNAGPVMAAGAGAIGVRLGGAAPYHGVMSERPPLGAGRAPDARAICDALALVRRSVWPWLIGIALVELSFDSFFAGVARSALLARSGHA